MIPWQTRLQDLKLQRIVSEMINGQPVRVRWWRMIREGRTLSH